MVYDTQKRQAMLDARRATRQKKEEQEARKTIRKYNTGKNKGQAAQTIRSAKNLIKNATPWGMLGLFRQISFSDWTYFLAFTLAILKDILDPLEVTGIWLIVVFIATLLCSIFIAMMMFISGDSRRRKVVRSWIALDKKWVVLILGTIIEFIPGIDILPIETATVAIIYVLALSDRKQAAEEIAAERKYAGYNQEIYEAA